jgi:sulfur-carrier protein
VDHEQLEGGHVAVEVKIPTVFRKFTDQQATVQVEAGTIEDVIGRLNDRFPTLRGQLLTEEGEIHRFVNIYLNDEDVRYLDKLATRADDGDTVALLPSVAGG